MANNLIPNDEIKKNQFHKQNIEKKNLSQPG
jgi:hypothetical protein